VDVPGEKLPDDLPGYLRATVAPQIPEELRPAFLTALEAEPIRSMQNKQLTSQPLHQPGVCWGAGVCIESGAMQRGRRLHAVAG
jgi:hypothetical protein